MNLNGTAITDAGLAQLGALTEMKRLNISHTKVSDAGLENVKAFKNLAILEIQDIKATEAGDQGGFSRHCQNARSGGSRTENVA